MRHHITRSLHFDCALLLGGANSLTAHSGRRRRVVERPIPGRTAVTLAILVLLMVACSAPAAAADSSYQFTILAKQGDTFDGHFLQSPQGAAINASGTIVYIAQYECAPMAMFCEDVFQTALSNLGSAPTLVNSNGNGPRIADNGTIVFGCSGGVCTQSGVIAKPGDTTGGNGPISYIDDWSISPSGDIVFMAIWESTNPDGSVLDQQGLLTPSALFVVGCGSTARAETVYPCTGASGDLIDGRKMYGVSTPIGFNPNGDWAFNCTPDPGGSFPEGTGPGFSICTREHILVQPGSVIGTNGLTSLSLIGSTSSGTVVFMGAAQNVASQAVYTLNPTGVVVQPGDTVAGYHIDDVSGQMALSSGGTLAFLSDFTDSAGSQGLGIFVKSASASTLERRHHQWHYRKRYDPQCREGRWDCGPDDQLGFI